MLTAIPPMTVGGGFRSHVLEGTTARDIGLAVFWASAHSRTKTSAARTIVASRWDQVDNAPSHRHSQWAPFPEPLPLPDDQPGLRWSGLLWILSGRGLTNIEFGGREQLEGRAVTHWKFGKYYGTPTGFPIGALCKPDRPFESIRPLSLAPLAQPSS